MKIAVLVHRDDELESTRYLVKELAAVWREAGHAVAFRRGPEGPIDADLGIAHVDLTRVPRAYLDWFEQCPRVLNRHVHDVSKRVISRQLVRRGDGYEGPVIVKTNANFGGLREYRHDKHSRKPRQRLRHARRSLPWTLRTRLPHQDYRIYDSSAQVPALVWLNRSLVVERFLPEREGAHYALRVWLFFGDRQVHTRVVGPDPIVKGEGAIRFDPLDEAPQALVQRRTELGFDYGKFDYGIVNGEVVLYDANPTPGLPYEAERFRPKAQHLAAGLDVWR